MRQSKKQKQLREFIEQSNAEEGEEVLRRDSGMEKVYKGEVVKADNVNKESVDNSAKGAILEGGYNEKTFGVQSLKRVLIL